MDRLQCVALATAVTLGWWLARRTKRVVMIGDPTAPKFTDADFTLLFGMSTGLHPETPVSPLQNPLFTDWEQLSASLPQLNRAGTLKNAISTLDILPAAKLTSIPELQRAYVLLAQLVHSWIHGVGEQVVPPQLAIPFGSVCRRLGLPLCLTATGADLWNVALLDPTKSWVPSNVTCISTCTGTKSEIGFHAVPAAMLHRLGENGLLRRLVNLPGELMMSRYSTAVLTLRDLTAALIDCRQLFKTVKTLVDVDEFNTVYRPLLGGFGPVTFMGLGASGKTVVSLKGPSAGQHVIFHIIDALLGVPYESAGEDRMAAFQAEVLTYNCFTHQNLYFEVISRIEASGVTVRSAATSSGGELLQAYQGAVRALKDFRSRHLGTATRYLGDVGRGTGESPWKSMLREAVETTATLL